jgi:hypothetical protein
VRYKDCRDVANTLVLSEGYPATAREIADWQVIVAGYRLAELLKRVVVIFFA